MSSGKGNTAHFVWRCGLCKRESSAKFDPGFKPQPYPADANGQFAPFLTIDCRGLEFVGFDPRVCRLILEILWVNRDIRRERGGARGLNLAPSSTTWT